MADDLFTMCRHRAMWSRFRDELRIASGYIALAATRPGNTPTYLEAWADDIDEMLHLAAGTSERPEPEQQ